MVHVLLQANGAKQYMTVGIVFQRALLITTAIAAILVLPLWLNVGRILTKFGEPLPMSASHKPAAVNGQWCALCTAYSPRLNLNNQVMW